MPFLVHDMSSDFQRIADQRIAASEQHCTLNIGLVLNDIECQSGTACVCTKAVIDRLWRDCVERNESGYASTVLSHELRRYAISALS